MNVASLELCKELDELSGWDDTLYYRYERTDPKSVVALHFIGNSAMGMTVNGSSTGFHVDEYDQLAPAYDLGYLLRKLPGKIHRIRMNLEPSLQFVDENKWWVAQYQDGSYTALTCVGDTPEDALTKLTIELFKQNILTKET